jgi:zinc-ribbon domain
MIVTCPSCATRHDFPNALRAPGDVRITCRSCGNRWIEIDADATIDIESFRRTANPHRHVEPDYEPEEDVQKLVAAARDARASFAEHRQARSRKSRAWAAYGLFLALPFVGAGLFPETVVAAAPIAAKAYERLGLNVNIYGLEIRRVEQQHALIKGLRVLSVKGEIVNTTNDLQKIPWLHFALQDGSSKEIYTWTLDTAARPLRPGESTSFVTRVKAPPDASENLQIRFAKAHEIGSNATP